VRAGPTGLMLADDLARAGLGCTVLERRAEVSNLTRAFAVHTRTLELLDARGFADDLVAAGARVGELRVFGQLEVDLSRLPSRFPYVPVTPQYHTERVLEAYASAFGAPDRAGVDGLSYLELVVLLTWQALRGQPLSSPDAATLSALFALLVTAGTAACAVVLRAWRGRQE